jgi:four helix bundle protein
VKGNCSVKRNHRSLKAWQASIVLVEHVYQATRSFPRDEIFGLVSQMRRCAVSVPANIAEGSARSGTKELLQFLSIAAASLSELDTHVEIAIRLGYIKDDALVREIDDVGGLIMGLIASIKRRLA